jgi:AhpD family alkylhydroperoxidase
MSARPPIEYRDAAPEVRAVFDDIKRSRQVDDVNNFWKYLAHDPRTLKRTWESVKEVMAPGALDAVTKEMIYLAVSVTNGCAYCIASHGAAARKAGMSGAMFGRRAHGRHRHGERNQSAGQRLSRADRPGLRELRHRSRLYWAFGQSPI